LLEVAKNTHDVTSLDTWSRRRIDQLMLACRRHCRLLYTPQNTLGTLPMTRTPVYRLSPFWMAWA